MQIRAFPTLTFHHLPLVKAVIVPRLSTHKIINVISQYYTNNNNITTIHKHPFNIAGSLWGRTKLNFKYSNKLCILKAGRVENKTKELSQQPYRNTPP